MNFFVIAIVSVLFSSTAPTGPIVAPLNQSSDVIVVGNVHPGGRVDVYANAVWIGAATARSTIVAVTPMRDLFPGDEIIATERIGAYTSYTVVPTLVAHDYPTYHYDNLRTGWNQSEATLTQENVGSSSFGRLFSTPVDGNVYAQPLVLTGVNVPGQGTHDVLYVATENDSLYALDAASGAVLWKQNYADASRGFTPVSVSDVGGCPFISPTIGITGTPVIDRASGTMYFVTEEKKSGTGTTFHHFFHAVDVTTGLDRTGSPVDIKASFPIPGGGTVAFDPQWQLQRPGLLLKNGVVYLGFGSYCDIHRSMSHGWVIAYSASSLAQLAVFNTSPGSSNGLSSVWAAGYGIAADRSGSLYFATGNGDFNANTGGALWGDTLLKLSPSLKVANYFTPFDQATLNSTDADLGGGGPMLLPPQAGAFPRLLVEEGKARTLFLVNRDLMGGYTPGGPDHVVQELQNVIGQSHGVWGGPGYYVSPSGEPVIFYSGGGDYLKAFALVTSPMTALMLIDKTNVPFGGEGGSIPAVTSNGTMAGTPVVWAIERPRSTDEEVRLRAFAADNLTNRLADLPAGPWLNASGGFFPAPTVINGRVYVGSANAVTGFGLH